MHLSTDINKENDFVPECAWRNCIEWRCCDSRWAEECWACEVIKNAVTWKICKTICKLNANSDKKEWESIV